MEVKIVLQDKINGVEFKEECSFTKEFVLDKDSLWLAYTKTKLRHENHIKEKTSTNGTK